MSYLIANSAGILLGLTWNWVWSSRAVWGDAPPPPLRTANLPR